MIRIEHLLSQDNVAVTGESANVYLLAKLFPSATEETLSIPLNVSLVIDNSGSMYGSDQRIHHAIEAACHVVDLLRPSDILSVIAFSDRAKIFQESIPVQNKENIKALIRSIITWQSGGTRMAAGMELACEAIHRNLSSERVNRVLLLTDGITEEEPTCDAIAQRETRNGIVFSTFGLGHDWNQPFLARLADLGRGRWYYIENPTAIPDVFNKELVDLKDIFLNDVHLNLSLKLDSVKSARLVEPEIADVEIQHTSEGEVSVLIGAMQKSEPVFCLFSISLAARKSGRYRIANLVATFRTLGQVDKMTKTDPISVEVTYTTDTSQIFKNGEVLRYVDLQQVDKLVKTGTILIEQGEKDKGTIMLTNASRISSLLGDKKKTKIIQDALGELGITGRIDNKTQLAMADQARTTKLMPEDDIED